MNRAAIPPHTRILLALAIILCLIVSKSLYAFAGFGLIVILLWQLSDVSVKEGIRRLLLIDSLIILTILPLPFSFTGGATLIVGWFELSQEGLIKALEVLIKSTLSVSITLTLLAGMNDIQLARALQRLKFSSRFIVLLQFTVRYISVMQQELFRLKLALRAIGFGKGPTLHTWKSYGYLFGTLFVRALARADQIWLAMKCRGFQGKFSQVKQDHSKLLDRRSKIVIATSLLIVIADVFYLLPGFRF
ncbi:energy-coupling factor transporter transmembrane component T family protein [Vibrio sonorensis]|uniref:energy-coupling factor transporter transmembrane component T family protein n=1 Tax=Vibrio sonorensis TaxID=1004316 RepID=UPI00248081AC|nr:energy-coupling factor transporter transmembrane component T [Vibrio sonorensis]